MIEEITDNNKTEIKKIHDTIYEALRSIMILGLDQEEVLSKIQEEIAEENKLYKKDGTTLDLSKVKKANIKHAIHLVETGENKLQRDADDVEEYAALIKSKKITSEKIDRFNILTSESKELSSDLNAEKKQFKDNIEPNILKSIDETAKETVKIEKLEMQGKDIPSEESTSKQALINFLEMLDKIKKIVA